MLQIQVLRLLIKERDDKKFAFDEFGQLISLLARMLDNRIVSVHDTKARHLMEDSVRELNKVAEPLKEALEEFASVCSKFTYLFLTH